MKKDSLIIVNLLLVLYVGLKGIEKGSSIILLVSMLLVIVGLQILDLIFSEEIKGKFLLISAIISFLGSKYIIAEALILTTLIITQYFIQYRKKYWVALWTIFFLSIIAYKENILIDYILLSGFITTFLIVFFRSQTRLNYLEKDIEEKREEISKLKSLFVKNEEYRKQTEVTFRLQERNNLSIQLHDKIGHAVSGAIFQLEATKIVFEKDKEKGMSLLQSTIDLLRTGVDEIRYLLRDAKPASEEIGINKIKLILEEKLHDSSYKYTVNYIGDLEEISLIQWGIFIDAVRELSTNSLKYSKGNFIKVTIEILNKFVKLEVSDNGVGTDKIVKGIGLKSLEEKILEQKGKLILDGSNGFKTIVLLQREVN